MGLEETTDNALFEGLFVYGLEVTPELEERLRALGYDRRRPQSLYPTEVFHACVLAAGQSLLPSLSAEEAMRTVGTRLVGGFSQTIIGRVVLAGLSLVGPDAFLKRLPGRMMAMRKGITCESSSQGPGQWEVRVRDRFPLGPFFAGAMAEVLRRAGAREVSTHAVPEPEGYRISLAFTKG